MNDTIPDFNPPSGDSFHVSSSESNTDSYLGRQLGHLRIESCIGEGGFGAVYRAVHENLGTAFAVKVLHAKHLDKGVMVQRFEREARTIAQLTHPNVIHVTDFGQFEDGSYYLVMELLEGLPLDDFLVQRRSFTFAQLSAILEQLCSALMYVHSRGVVHRDLKPANIFLSFTAGQKGLLAKLLDFGIAGLSDEPTLTRTGVVLGSPLYMSPEQISGNAKNADLRADLYSFGIIVFHLLTGTPPFVASDMMGILYNHMHAPLPLLSDIRPAFSWSPFLQEFLKKATAKAPHERFQHADELLVAFQRAFDAQRLLTPDATFPQYPLGKELLLATDEPKAPRLRLNRQTMLVFQQKLVAQKRTLFWASLFAALFVGLGVAGTWYFLRVWPEKKAPKKHKKTSLRPLHRSRTLELGVSKRPLMRVDRSPRKVLPSKSSEVLVQIFVEPSDAEVMINQESLACPPCAFKAKADTSVHLDARAAGFENKQETIHLPKDQKKFSYTIKLNPFKKRSRKRLVRVRPTFPTPPRARKNKSEYDPF